MIVRQIGKTTAAMVAAPRDAVYVWVNTHLDYPTSLAQSLGRYDLLIVRPDWVNKRNLCAIDPARDVVIDHAARLDDEAWHHVLQRAEQRQASRAASSTSAAIQPTQPRR